MLAKDLFGWSLSFPPYYGDSPEDHYWIQRGIDYYNNGR